MFNNTSHPDLSESTFHSANLESPFSCLHPSERRMGSLKARFMASSAESVGRRQ